MRLPICSGTVLILRWSSILRLINCSSLDDMDKRQFDTDQHVHLVTCEHFGGMSSDDAKRAVQILRKE